MSPFFPGEMQVPELHLVISETIPKGRMWHLITALLRMEIEAPHMVFAGGGKTVPHFFCGTWLNSSGYCLKVFCLARLSFLHLLAKESIWQGGTYFVLSSMAFPGYEFLQIPVWGMWGQKTTEGSHCCVIAWISGFLAGLLSSLGLLELSYVCFTCNARGFYLYLACGKRWSLRANSFKIHIIRKKTHKNH